MAVLIFNRRDIGERSLGLMERYLRLDIIKNNNLECLGTQ